MRTRAMVCVVCTHTPISISVPRSLTWGLSLIYRKYTNMVADGCIHSDEEARGSMQAKN